MWHAVAAVTQNYDPILCEKHEPSNILILNAGPGIIHARAWLQIQTDPQPPQINIEMRPGDQRFLAGSLVRVHLHMGDFAAIAWRIVS
jgi:hypothetical protein